MASAEEPDEALDDGDHVALTPSGQAPKKKGGMFTRVSLHQPPCHNRTDAGPAAAEVEKAAPLLLTSCAAAASSRADPALGRALPCLPQTPKFEPAEFADFGFDDDGSGDDDRHPLDRRGFGNGEGDRSTPHDGG